MAKINCIWVNQLGINTLMSYNVITIQVPTFDTNCVNSPIVVYSMLTKKEIFAGMVQVVSIVNPSKFDRDLPYKFLRIGLSAAYNSALTI